MKKYKKILKIALNVFIWLFVAFSVFMTILAIAAQSNADGVPAIGGKCFLTIASDSMSPTFEKGDLVFGQILTSDEKQKLEVNDVITFYADLDGNGRTELNSHRIVEVRYDDAGAVVSYVTKGDNKETNPVEDSPVPWKNVICKCDEDSVIGGVGGFIAFLQTSTGFLLFIVLPLVVFFVYELFIFIKTLLDVKKKEAEKEGHAITAEEEEEIKRKAIEEYIRQQQQNAEEKAPETSSENDEKTETADSAEG